MTATDAIQTRAADFVLVCDELNVALDYFTTRIGFRLDVIFPADDPRTAVLTGYGKCLHLRRDGSMPQAEEVAVPSIVVTQAGKDPWGTGRAGMQYRDLIPDRLGGQFIASHIRIEEGGPVPDYVHHHHVKFQMIYCYKGWVRVVYEDQGPPIVMQAGDCVLQPPHIRHRVLECSAGMEVVEIAGPAEHETFVEHDIRLPSRSLQPERNFDGQRFVFHQAVAASWLPAPIDGFEARDTGIAVATNGVASVMVLRAIGDGCAATISHDAEFLFNFVLRGSTTLRCSNDEEWQLSSGDSFVIPARVRFALENNSTDLELLQVGLPGGFTISGV
jgi:quercetin dioxygenase-like cupin family protein